MINAAATRLIQHLRDTSDLNTIDTILLTILATVTAAFAIWLFIL